MFACLTVRFVAKGGRSPVRLPGVSSLFRFLWCPSPIIAVRLKTQRRRLGRGLFVEVLQHAGLQMLILFTIVLLGAVARKLHLMNDDFDALLSKLVMTVTLPGMILNSVLGNSNLPDSQTIVMVMVYSTVL